MWPTTSSCRTRCVVELCAVFIPCGTVLNGIDWNISTLVLNCNFLLLILCINDCHNFDYIQVTLIKVIHQLLVRKIQSSQHCFDGLTETTRRRCNNMLCPGEARAGCWRWPVLWWCSIHLSTLLWQCPLRQLWHHVLHDPGCHGHTQLLPSGRRVGLCSELNGSVSAFFSSVFALKIFSQKV